jgi:membrane protease YdiL (CAAX protease family)
LTQRPADGTVPAVPDDPRGSDFSVTVLAGSSVALATLLLGFTAEALDPGIGLLFTELVCFLGVSWGVLRLSGRSPGRYVGLHLHSAWPLAFGAAVGVANFFAVVAPIQALVQWGMDAVIRSHAPSGLHDVLVRWRDIFDGARLLRGRSRFELGLLIAGVSAVAPFCEEFFFRGVIQQGLVKRLSRRGVIVGALIFATAHLDPVSFAGLTELGLLFGLLYLRSGTVWTAVGAHAANNLVSVILFFASPPERSNELPDPQTVLAVAATGGLLLLALLWAASRFPRLLTDSTSQTTPAGPSLPDS